MENHLVFQVNDRTKWFCFHSKLWVYWKVYGFGDKSHMFNRLSPPFGNRQKMAV
jgi:hypothetical protein